jgi:hypothetical protein
MRVSIIKDNEYVNAVEGGTPFALTVYGETGEWGKPTVAEEAIGAIQVRINTGANSSVHEEDNCVLLEISVEEAFALHASLGARLKEAREFYASNRGQDIFEE